MGGCDTCNGPRPQALASCVNVSVRNRAAISLIAEPAPQPRVYVRIASCEFGFRLVFLAGVCIGASIGARATGFSVCVGLVWRSVRLYRIGHTPTGPQDSSHYTTQGMPQGCRTDVIAESTSSVNIIGLPPSTNNPTKTIGVQSDVERGVNTDAHISMPHLTEPATTSNNSHPTNGHLSQPQPSV